MGAAVTLDPLRLVDQDTGEEFWYLRLYVAGPSPRSLRAVANLKRLCEHHLHDGYEIEVIDLVEEPALARADGIVALPTLVRRLPGPPLKIIGDLSDAEPRRRHAGPATEAAAMTAPGPPAWDDLRARLAEAEETLRAIGAGEVDAVVVADDGGEHVFTLGTAEFPYRLFVEHMRDGAATLSPDGLVLYTNQRMADLLGRSRSALVGASFDTLLADGSVAAHLLGADGLGATFEVDLLDGDGGVVTVLLSASPLGLGGERLVCITLTDLTDKRAQDREIMRLNRVQAEQLAALRAAQAALNRQATHDFLTGLPNRALLVDRAEQALARPPHRGVRGRVLHRPRPLQAGQRHPRPRRG